MTKFEIQHTHSGWQSCVCSWVCSFVTNTMKSSDLHCYSNKYQRFFLVLFDQNWQLPVLAGIKSRKMQSLYLIKLQTFSLGDIIAKIPSAHLWEGSAKHFQLWFCITLFFLWLGSYLLLLCLLFQLQVPVS